MRQARRPAQLGSASVYSHSSGVTQPGFLTNTKTLLPWDVPLRRTDWTLLQSKWPNLAEICRKKPSFHPATTKSIGSPPP